MPLQTQPPYQYKVDIGFRRLNEESRPSIMYAAVVTNGVSHGLISWYFMMMENFQGDLYVGWIPYIWEPLCSMARAVVKFMSKAFLTEDSHNNLLDGFLFVYQENQFHEVILHNRMGGGSFQDDLHQFMRILIVICCHLPPNYLSCKRKLMEVEFQLPPTDGTVKSLELIPYILRLNHMCDEMKFDPCEAGHRLIFQFLLEDPLFWTEQEKVDFLRRFTYFVFCVVTDADQADILSYMGPLDDAKLDGLRFPSDPVIDDVFNNRKVEVYCQHGKIMRLVRNAIQHYREYVGRTVRGKPAHEIQEIVDKDFTSQFGFGILRYTFRGVINFLTYTTKMEPGECNAAAWLKTQEHLRARKLDLLYGFEFRQGFYCYDYSGDLRY